MSLLISFCIGCFFLLSYLNYNALLFFKPIEEKRDAATLRFDACPPDDEILKIMLVHVSIENQQTLSKHIG